MTTALAVVTPAVVRGRSGDPTVRYPPRVRLRSLLAVGLIVASACTRSDPPEVTQPATARLDATPVSKGIPMKPTSPQPAVATVTLTVATTITDLQVEHLAVAPDGKTWATAFGPVVRTFSGDQPRTKVDQQHNAAGSIGFSADSATLHLGNHDLDVTSLAPLDQPAIPDLAAWAASKGLPAPPSLAMAAARKSDDGALLVVGGSGVTRDRKRGQQDPASGDVDWLIALDGKTRQPTDVLWHGRGAYNRIAISERFVAAGGHGPLLVFDRADLATAIDLGAACARPSPSPGARTASASSPSAPRRRSPSGAPAPGASPPRSGRSATTTSAPSPCTPPAPSWSSATSTATCAAMASTTPASPARRCCSTTTSARPSTPPPSSPTAPASSSPPARCRTSSCASTSP